MNKFVLKILSGLNCGAELQLNEGNYNIGSHESNDLVFNDESLAEKHLRIILSDSGLAIRPFVLPVYLKGKPVSQGGGIVDNFDVITIGDTHFALAPSDVIWPDKIELPKIKKKAAESSLSADGSHSRSIFALIPYSRIVIPSLLVVALVLFVGDFFSERSPIVSAEQKIQAVLDEMNLYKLQLIKQPNNTIRLSGFVQQSKTVKQLEEKLRKSGVAAINRVHAIDDLKDNTKRVLRALGYDRLQVSASKKNAGEMILKGFVDDKSSRQSIVDTLRYDIPGVKNIDYSAVETLEQRLDFLQNEIKKLGLQKKLSVLSTGGILKIEGTLNGIQMENWKIVHSTFQEKYGEEPPLESDIKTKKLSIKLALRSVSIGTTAYLITKKGNKYIEGAFLDNGYLIKSISPGKIVLSKKGTDVDYLYGRR